MNIEFDRQKSLQELDQDDWGEPEFDSSLATTVHQLRRKPLDQFSSEDLRIMIGQQIGLPFLIPLALERLESEPLAEGDCYCGDLLAALLRVNSDFWARHPAYAQSTLQIVGRVKDLLPSLDESNRAILRQVLADAPRILKE